MLKAFDHFRRTIGENACFETVMNDFRVHEDLPLDQYNLEYSVGLFLSGHYWKRPRH